MPPWSIPAVPRSSPALAPRWSSTLSKMLPPPPPLAWHSPTVRFACHVSSIVKGSIPILLLLAWHSHTSPQTVRLFVPPPAIGTPRHKGHPPRATPPHHGIAPAASPHSLHAQHHSGALIKFRNGHSSRQWRPAVPPRAVSPAALFSLYSSGRHWLMGRYQDLVVVSYIILIIRHISYIHILGISYAP